MENPIEQIPRNSPTKHNENSDLNTGEISLETIDSSDLNTGGLSLETVNGPDLYTGGIGLETVDG